MTNTNTALITFADEILSFGNKYSYPRIRGLMVDYDFDEDGAHLRALDNAARAVMETMGKKAFQVTGREIMEVVRSMELPADVADTLGAFCLPDEL